MSDENSQHLPKVLIVDDSRMVRASLIKHIRGRFQFREEADGEAGWQALVVDPDIELVLSDITMPKLDGYELLQRIRDSKLSRLSHIPVVIISGDEDEAARERARQLGASDFITKGISSSELLARLDSLWRLVQTRRELEESRAALEQQSSLETITPLAEENTTNRTQAVTKNEKNIQEYHGKLHILVLQVDQYSELDATAAKRIVRKLSQILSAKSHSNDTILDLGGGSLALYSYSSDTVSCCTFAIQLKNAISKLVMTYHNKSIHTTLSIGVADATVKNAKDISSLQKTASGYAAKAHENGGNQAVCSEGVITTVVLQKLAKQSTSIDLILQKLRYGDGSVINDNLPDIVAYLLPLLEIIESQLHCGLPMDKLRAYQKTVDSAEPSA